MEQDKIFKQIITKKESPKVPKDLEQKIMVDISHIVTHKTVNRRSFHLAWLFLVIGAILGIFLSSLLLNSDLYILGTKLNQLRLPILVFVTGTLLIIFDRLFRVILKKEY